MSKDDSLSVGLSNLIIASPLQTTTSNSLANEQSNSNDVYDPALFDKQKNQLDLQLSLFKNQIIQFSKKHNEELKNDLNLARQFVQLCSKIGISFNQLVDNKSIYLFHPMDYYYNLCIELIEVVRDLESMNGGLTSYKELLIRLNISHDTIKSSDNNTNDNQRSIEDIDKALEMLKDLNGGFNKLVIGGKAFIQSVPLELTKDQNFVYEVCFLMGFVTIQILRDNYKWDKYRCKQVLNKMVSDGLLWIDIEDPKKEVKYWDPGWIINL